MSARRKNDAQLKAEIATRLDVLERLLSIETLCPTCGQPRPENNRSSTEVQIRQLIKEMRAAGFGK